MVKKGLEMTDGNQFQGILLCKYTISSSLSQSRLSCFSLHFTEEYGILSYQEGFL